MGEKLKRIDFDKPSIKTEKHEYKIIHTLSFERYKEFEKLSVHVGFGTSFEAIFEQLSLVWTNLNKMKLAESAVIVHDIMNGIKGKMDGRVHPGLMLAALFVNRQDEDVTKYDKELMEDKIKDWSTEYAINDFFLLATHLVEGFWKNFKKVSENTFEKAKV